MLETCSQEFKVPPGKRQLNNKFICLPFHLKKIASEIMNLKGVDALSNIYSYVRLFFNFIKFNFMTSWDPFQPELSYGHKLSFMFSLAISI